ncbi:MAG TPA: decaprenyl-phosphate phosphoribosyltransferase [bacterium]|nr:decaprenyl-phosphate phosphoribosyltransferase [bacterium]HPQ66272.1 decaprenyl-phosphate phosphoribosyltransferase [bacterium]
MIKVILISMRPRQWLKNGFVLAALVFSRGFVDSSKVGRALWTMAVFCCLSSAVYIFNDVVDRRRDARHPRKQGRPIASGLLPVPSALAAAVPLAAAGLAGAFLVSWTVGLAGSAYLVLMLLYSLILSRIAIVDVLVIALGFILRVLAGGLAVGVGISNWLYLCTFLLALFLALGKRRREVGDRPEAASGTRPQLSLYTGSLLDQMISIAAAATLMAYALYTLDGRTRAEVSPLMFLTLPLVVYGLLRYVFLLQCRGAGEEPERVLLSDPALLGTVALWVGAVVVILSVAGAGGGG